MAQGLKHVCDNCNYAIEAWDEGDPYFLDDAGDKQYAYHPNPERDRCIGVDSPHLCLKCGNEFAVDSLAPVAACPKCRSRQIVDTFQLAGRHCPFCNKGTFVADADFYPIS